MSEVSALIARLRCLVGRHTWLETEPYKRRCPACGRRETLFWRKYPAIGEPAYAWRRQDIPAGRLNKSPTVDGDASKSPLLSEQQFFAGADHTPGSAAKDGLGALSEQSPNTKDVG